MDGRLEHEIKINEYISKKLEDMPEYVTEWHNKLKASNKTAASRKDFINKIRRFLIFIDKDLKVEPKDITVNKVEEYFISCQTTKDKFGNIAYTSDSYKQCIWIVLNNFLGFMENRGYIEKNHIKNIDKPRNNDLDRINENRILLTKKDFKKIYFEVENDCKYNYVKNYHDILNKRDAAIMLLFMTTGIRETALTEINIDNINIDEGKLYVVDKGNKKHTYILNDKLMEVITEWIEIRETIENSTNALFITEKGNRIAQRTLVDVVKKFTNRALGKELSPHKLRAGFCSILYKETGDVEFVRRAVGHSNLATTQRYITTNRDEKAKAVEIMSNIF